MKIEERVQLSCAFTGHRPEFLPWGTAEDTPECQAVKKKIYDAVVRAYDEGTRHFICGMARGCDFYFGEAVIALKERHGEVTLEGAVPFPEQTKGWSREDQLRHRRILERCDVETVVQHSYTKTCMLRRNQYMIDHAQRLIAVYNGKCRGGTYATINYAMDQKRTLDILYI